MKLRVFKTVLNEILPFRALHLQETNFQLRYNACHERGWTDSWLITMDDKAIGYGSVKGQEIADRDSVFEFYIAPAFRKHVRPAFSELLAESGVIFIECQSNDLMLASMLFEFAENINADVVLFEDHTATALTIPGAVFRRRRDDDNIFDHNGEPKGDYVIKINKEIVATGGFMLHYNKPFADLYMEVNATQRRKGFGSFLLQEVKKECYLSGRVPAARCNIENKASMNTLLKAGLKVAGYMLTGRVKKNI
jgi:GNAT superfamily N-acetyltransferase